MNPLTQLTLNLEKYSLKRPEKIRWMFPSAESDSILNVIPSPSLRTFLQNAEKILLENDIKYREELVTAEVFQNWLLSYQESMAEKGYDVIATMEWFHKKQEEGKEVRGLFFTQENISVGSLIFTKTKENKHFASYKISKDIPLISTKKHGSLGAIIDYVFFDLARKNGATWVSHGSARNAFGIFSSIHQLQYKLSFGLVPTIEEDATWTTVLPINRTSPVACFARSETNQNIFLYNTPKGKVEEFKHLPDTWKSMITNEGLYE